MRAAPALPVLSMGEHLDLLEKVYHEEMARGAGPVTEDRLMEHLEEQWERREFGFKELVRSEQWEQLVASLRQRIVELEVELMSRPPAPHEPDE